MTAGIVIGLIAFVWLGVSSLFEKGQYYATYFNQSVQGLQVDSPVKYRGVSIGRVAGIEVAPDSRLIEVIMKIEAPMELTSDVFAQLKVVGITGSMFIELDRKSPDQKYLSPVLTFPTEYPVVPSRPSDISELFRGIDEILQSINAMNLPEVTTSMRTTLENINTSINKFDLEGVSEQVKTSFSNLDRNLARQPWEEIITSVNKSSRSFNQTMDRARNTLDNIDTVMNRLDTIVTSNEKSVNTAVQDFQKVMNRADTTFQEISIMLANTGNNFNDLSTRLIDATGKMERVLDNLNKTMDRLSDQPSQLFLVEPAPPRKIENK